MTVRVCVIVKSVTYSGSKISSKERRNEKEKEKRSSCKSRRKTETERDRVKNI